jgi:LacI family transcriptional regulator, galactose operon repressor
MAGTGLRVTIADVAKLAGVSTASVSRALSGADGVSEQVRKKVSETADRIGYRPNELARSLRTTRTRTLGLVVSDVVNPFFGELALAIEEAAHASGFSVILCNTNEDTSRQDEYIELLRARRIDGLLLTPALDESPALRAAAFEEIPMVFVDRALPAVQVPVVRADGRHATRDLVDHLVGLGHERIAIISGPRQTLTGRERLNAFRARMRRHGLSVPRELTRVGNFQMHSGQVAAAELLDLDEPPTAVFAADNLMALGALHEIRRRGLRIGRDLALAGFDDPPWFQLLDPPMTTVAQPIKKLGELAVETLLQRVAGAQASSHVLECSLMVRNSCGEAPSPLP